LSHLLNLLVFVPIPPEIRVPNILSILLHHLAANDAFDSLPGLCYQTDVLALDFQDAIPLSRWISDVIKIAGLADRRLRAEPLT
jgi:hypothetical protein